MFVRIIVIQICYHNTFHNETLFKNIDKKWCPSIAELLGPKVPVARAPEQGATSQITIYCYGKTSYLP